MSRVKVRVVSMAQYWSDHKHNSEAVVDATKSNHPATGEPCYYIAGEQLNKLWLSKNQQPKPLFFNNNTGYFFYPFEVREVKHGRHD